MSREIAFLVGLVATMGIVFLALLYLRNPLQVILTDLCGTVESARFWTAFSNIIVFLVPLVLALDHQPPPNGIESSVFVICGQIESAITGLIVSIVIVGLVLSWHISRIPQSRASKGIDARASGSQREPTAI
jgi:hypothetical protein